jgi:MFS family permease
MIFKRFFSLCQTHTTSLLLVFLNAFFSFTSILVGLGLSFWIYTTFHRPDWMAFSVFFYTTPRIYLSFFAGFWVDRWGKWRVMKGSLILLCLTYLIPGIVGMGLIKQHALISLLILQGLLGGLTAFYEVATFSLISDGAKGPSSGFLYGIMEISSSVSTLLAPLFIGFLGRTWPVSFFFWGCGLSAFCFLMLLEGFFGKVPPQKEVLEKSRLKIFSEIFNEIFSDFILRRLILYFITLNLCNGFVSGLLNAYVLSRCDGSLKGLSTFGICLALGNLSGSLLAPQVRGKSLWPFMLWAGGLSAFGGRILFGCAFSLEYLCFWGALRAVLTPLINTANQILWNHHTPPQKRGRFLGTRRLLCQGGYPLSVGSGAWLCGFFPVFFKENLGIVMILSGSIELMMVSVFAFQAVKTRRQRSTVMGRLSLRLASFKAKTTRCAERKERSI